MIYIDTHCHIYPDNIAVRAAQSIGEFYDIPMREDGRLATMIADSDEAGISKNLVHSVATTPERVAHINDYLMRTVAEHPDRLIGFGTLHPDFPDVRAELKRIKAGGLIGVKLHPDFQHFCLDDESAIELFKAMADMNMPALVHTGDKRFPYSEPRRMAYALKKVPQLKAICAHLGGWSVWEDAWKELADLPNAWVDTSSSLYAITPDKAAEVIRHYGSERCFFGTDYPMWKPSEERARFEALPLTEDERENIAHRSFERFLAGLAK